MSSFNGSSKRLLIYTHYNAQGLLSSYVLFTLKKMNPFYQRVIFVSNSPIRSEHREELSEVTDKIIQRENKGFDFAAWRDAIYQEGWNRIEQYDYLTLMNDTCFGPIYDLAPVFKKMENKEADFWGITEHTDFKTGFMGLGHNIKAHLQSYFMSFNQKVLQNKAFHDFWNKVKDQKKVDHVIHKYEIGISNKLLNEGFLFESYLPPETFKEDKNNEIAFFHPQQLIKKKAPFLKVKSLLFFPHSKYLKKILQRCTEYDYNLIEEHITQTFTPNKALSVLDKNYVLPDASIKDEKSSLRIAMHLHAYFTDGLEKYFALLADIKSKVDLFITTDKESKRSQIQKILDDFDLGGAGIKFILTENRGRDILPWLKISDQLNEYDLVGHFHVKKSSTAPEWVGKAWTDDLLKFLLEDADSIFKEFEKNKKLGIAIPDIPYYFKKTDSYLMLDEDKEHIFRLWDSLDLKKTLDEETIDKPIMSYGTMFWYRPVALKPLLNYEMFEKEFPEEPLPLKNTIAHSFEGIAVYVAWSQNYDFRVVLHHDEVFSGFDVYSKTKLNKIITNIFKTNAWRIGRFITWIPWKIKRLVRGVTNNQIDFEN